jgi:subtilisin family serine protease
VTKLVLLFLLILPVACIKQDGKIPAPAAVVTTPPEDNPIGSGTDPLASEAWHLKNTGQASFSTNVGYGRSIAGHDIDIEGALNLGISGRGVRVAISDTGVEVNHPDLKGNELTGLHRNYGIQNPSRWHNEDPYPGSPSGIPGHGTSVTGLVAAVGWNGLGSRGVAPHAKFAGFQYVISYGSQTEESVLARTIDQTDGEFDIFNYSYGYRQCSYVQEDPTVNEAIASGTAQLRNGKGALYVQSAGNSFYGLVSECSGITLPVSYYLGNTNFSSSLTSPHKIIVGSVNAQGLLASYSTPGSGLWVTAPGGEYGTDAPAMVTTDLTGCRAGLSFVSALLNTFNGGREELNFGCHYNSRMNGTSSAAPVTTGTIALMLQANPNLTWRDVKHIIAETAEVIDNQNYPEVIDHPLSETLPFSYVYDYIWQPNATGKFYSNYYGFGRINALAAVLMAQTYNVNLGTYVETIREDDGSWYYSSPTLATEITDASAVGISSTIEVRHNFIVESVQIKLNIDHPKPSDLAVHLVSPSGRESRLFLMNSHTYAAALPTDKELLTNFFYGEESRGVWRLKVYDGDTGDVGILTGWSIKINGHKVVPDGSNPDPVYNLSMAGSYSSGRTSPLATYIPSVSPDLARYEISVGTSPGASDVSAWESIGIATTAQFEDLSLVTNRYYYFNIRAVDDRENISAVQSAAWLTTF